MKAGWQAEHFLLTDPCQPTRISESRSMLEYNPILARECLRTLDCSGYSSAETEIPGAAEAVYWAERFELELPQGDCSPTQTLRRYAIDLSKKACQKHAVIFLSFRRVLGFGCAESCLEFAYRLQPDCEFTPFTDAQRDCFEGIENVEAYIAIRRRIKLLDELAEISHKRLKLPSQTLCTFKLLDDKDFDNFGAIYHYATTFNEVPWITKQRWYACNSTRETFSRDLRWSRTNAIKEAFSREELPIGWEPESFPNDLEIYPARPITNASELRVFLEGILTQTQERLSWRRYPVQQLINAVQTHLRNVRRCARKWTLDLKPWQEQPPETLIECEQSLITLIDQLPAPLVRLLQNADNTEDTRKQPAVEISADCKEVTVFGIEKPELFDAQCKTVRALLEAFPSGLQTPELNRRAKCDAKAAMDSLRDNDNDWKRAIKYPGGPNKGGYRIIEFSGAPNGGADETQPAPNLG